MLHRALDSLLAQTMQGSFEVLVIDNGSTDDTRQVAESFAERFDLRYFYDAKPGLHVGRHRGLREAKHDVLVYADDDIEALPSWLEAIADCFSDPKVALVGGNNYPNFESEPPEWLRKLWSVPAYGGRAITWLSVLELSAGRREVTPFTVWGCNFSIRKDVLVDAGGFHPDGMPDDHIRFRGDGETHVSAHVLKRGLRTLFDSSASVRHAVTRSRMTLEYFRKRAYSQGISDSYSRLRNGAPVSDGAWLASAEDAVRMIARRVRSAAQFMLKDAELRQVDRVLGAGYRDGFAYHQNVYQRDPEVRAWVHQPDYL